MVSRNEALEDMLFGGIGALVIALFYIPVIGMILMYGPEQSPLFFVIPAAIAMTILAVSVFCLYGATFLKGLRSVRSTHDHP